MIVRHGFRPFRPGRRRMSLVTLARRAPFRVLHNHLTLDAITPVLPIETPGFWPLVRPVRREIVAAAAAAPA